MEDKTTPEQRHFIDNCAEYPFVKNGMSYDEYWKELKYYYRHLEEVHNGKYKPLWQQNNELCTKASEVIAAHKVGMLTAEQYGESVDE